MTDDTIRVRIWHGRYDEYPDEPDETGELGPDDPHLWQDDPYYHEPVAFDVHPDDRPATLYVTTNDSVRKPSLRDHAEWGRAIERGLPYEDDREYRPYGCEIWGRVRFVVEEGNTRD